jgi:N-acetylglutamate synthase-like GNAT family acetyltransferase
MNSGAVIQYREGYNPAWVDQIMNLHNKTEMKRTRPEQVNQAFATSFAVVTAWMDNQIIACGRMISDGQMCSAIFDVVVDPAFQKRGVGKGIVEKLIAKAPDTMVHLTSTFGNEAFYQKIGFKKHKTAMALYPARMASSPYLE